MAKPSFDTVGYVNSVLQNTGSTGYTGNKYVGSSAGWQSAAKQPAPANQFLGNVGKSIGSIPGALVHGTQKLLSDSSFAKIPQVIGAYGSLGRQNASLAKRDVIMKQLSKDFHSGKISAKEYSKKLNSAIASTNIDKEMKHTNAALKDASHYGDQFMANAAILGTVVGGVAGLAGKTGLNAVGTAAVDQAYSGGAKAFGRGILGEAGALSRPFTGEAAGGVVKGLTGAAGGALDAQAMASTANEARKGKFDPLNTALTVSTALPGGPVKLLSEGGKKVASAASKAIYDTHGLYDVVKLKGGVSVNEAFNAAKGLSKNSAKEEKVLKVFQDLAVQEHGKGPNAVAKAIEANQPGGKKFADMTYPEFLKAADSIISDRRNLQAVAKKAGLAVDGAGVVAGRLTPETKAIISKRLAQADNPLAEFSALKKEGLIKGPNLPGQIEDMIKSGATGDQLAKQVNTLKSVQAALVDGKPVTTKDGRFLAFAKGAGTVKKAAEVAPIVQGKKAPLGVIGRTLEKAGLSTRQADPAEQKAIFGQVKDNFTKAINANNDIKLTGSEIMSRLNKLADSKKGVFDLRQLRPGEIAHELGVSKSEAKTILSSYNDAFKSLGYAERGLGGKITDFNMRHNPLAAPYSRIQSVGRYESNYGFRLQENIETASGSKALGGKLVAPGSDKYNKGVKILEDSGFFKRELAGTAGEGATSLGAISAKISPYQKKVFTANLQSLAGGEDKLASFVSNPANASLVQDLKSVAQYPDKGLTSSNLMKALNLAVFPLRYNLKVTSVAAKALGRENGVRQMAILKNLSDFNRWQKTPEGIKWNSNNSEVLGLLRYFTPVGSVEATLNLLGGNAKNIRDFGTVGGLPFGVISAVLQGQGAVKLDSPYLDPKTGEVVPTKVPKDLKSRANQALVDILGTLYTFPGRQVGFDSKRAVSQKAIDNVTFGLLKGGKTETVTRTDLTSQQRKQQAVLQKPKQPPKKPSSLNYPAISVPTKQPSDYVKPRPRPVSTRAARGKVRAIPVGRFRP